MESIRIKIRSTGCIIPEIEERECTAVECWYDPHYRHWVLYPVDAEGNQLDEASYGFGKKEAIQMRKDMETELIGRKY